LTKILRCSLGGNSKTAVVLCITPTEDHLEQTLSTLRFGTQAKKIENKPVINLKDTSSNSLQKEDLKEAHLKLKQKEMEINLLK